MLASGHLSEFGGLVQEHPNGHEQSAGGPCAIIYLEWIGLVEEGLWIIPCFLMGQRAFGSITIWTQLWWSLLPSEGCFQIVRIKITNPKCITQFLVSQVGRLA